MTTELKVDPLLLATTHEKYPPFLTCALENYFVKRFLDEKKYLEYKHVYFLPVHWTVLSNKCYMYHLDQPHAQAVKKMFAELPPKKKYYIICQYANGIKFPYPKHLNFEIHGGHAADRPLPLIYDDSGYLENQPKIPFHKKKWLCSFVGADQERGHRKDMCDYMSSYSDVTIHMHKWTGNIKKPMQQNFIDITTNSKFCLAPRGWGKSSFRFFEAWKLGSIPVYVWTEDIWLPYKDIIDYSKFSIIVHLNDVDKIHDTLLKIDEAQYNKMFQEYEKVKHLFTLEGFYNYFCTLMKKEDERYEKNLKK